MGISTLLHGLSTKDPRSCTPACAGDKLKPEELIRNRYQTGPNLGALFVQEKWIDSSLFNPENDTGGSELAALKSWGKASQDELRQKWEHHWKTFITDDDWRLMLDRGATCIRLPIGFYSLSDPSLLEHTPFSKYADIYKNSWENVVSIIRRAAEHHIGVLIDVHSLPGGANGDEHSGTSTGKAELWSTAKHRSAAIDTYVTVVKLLDEQPAEVSNNVVGLQLVNEAPYGESKSDGFYLDAASKIRGTSKLGESLPLVISDSWDCSQCVNTVKQWNEKVGDCGILVDTHVYRTFSDSDKGKSAEQHIDEARNAVQPQSDVDVYVGEWSCCLDEETWKKSHGDRGQLEADFGKAQLKNFSELAGNFFWTFKFGQGNGGSWDWRVMSEKGVALPRLQVNAGNQDESLKNALNGHKSYWDSQNKNTDWEYYRFEDGFKQGWQDAEAFAQFEGSRLGRLAAMKYARTNEHIKQKGKSDKVFNFEHGYEQGVKARHSA